MDEFKPNKRSLTCNQLLEQYDKFNRDHIPTFSTIHGITVIMYDKDHTPK